MKLSRRTFLKGSLFSGLTLGLASTVLGRVPGADEEHGTGRSLADYGASDVLYTVCEQCNTHCSIKAVIAQGKGEPYTSLVRKIAGNPYSPLNTEPFGPIPYNTPVDKAAQGQDKVQTEGRSFRGGRTCLKGQAGIQTAFDALRLRQPLKRVGPRGSGKWVTISWEQALEEIINGSPDLGTPGLKQLWAYVPEEQVMSDWARVKKGEMSWEDFDRKYREVLIDTRHPDLGPKANQIVSLGGDRRDFIHGRLWTKCLGSINAYDHAGICGISGVQGNLRSFSGPKAKKRMYADVDGAEFVIIWGTDPLVANKGPTWLAPKHINALKRGLKLAVVDPRMSKIAEKAHIWVPIYPGTDAALALGMARWIIENGRYDKRYLTNPNKEAAEADGEPTWTDATHLVNVDHPDRPKLRAADLGIGSRDQFVVIENGKPVPHDQAQEGELEVDTTINGIRVKSVFTLFKERVMERTIEEYADICRIKPEQIVELAREFTSHGKRAAITSYRGPAKHVNGYYNLRAINCLNHLIGNYDWKGGSLTTGARFKEFEGRYQLLEVPGGYKAWGIPLARVKVPYEKTSLFERDGYPARRPWFPFSNHVIQEVLPSAAEGYPYPIKALFIHRISPILSIPGGQEQAKILQDTQAIPLLVVFDVVMSETALYADYVLPDLTYLERWGFETIYPNIHLKLSHIMQPVTRVFPEPRPVEDVFIELFKRLGLPGVGEKAFPDGSPLHRAEDFYLKLVANIAFDGQPVPDASPEELKIFVEARQKALGKFFDLQAWQSAVKPEEWPKVVYVLNRGGRFEARGKEYEGDYLKYKFAGQANFYDEGVAKGKSSYDGKYFDGLPRYVEAKVSPEYPLALINWKARHIGTHRNIADAWLREIEAENFLWMHPEDAARRGLKTGDKVKIRSPRYEAVGTVLVTHRIRPGVVGCAYNYGHFAYGSRAVEIDGQLTRVVTDYGHNPSFAGVPRSGYARGRNTGFAVNYLIDNVSDPIGGSSAQLDARVEVTKLNL